PTDNPYLRAVADTSRGALALSATIRRFSSGVQRRRAPVWITSSRDTFDIVVCSVIRLCLRGFIPQRKAAVAGGLPLVRRAVSQREAKRPASTALAGAQLAARQLNCGSVFRGVLSYGRGRNNAPSASVAPRGSAQPGWPAIARTGFGCPKNAIRTMIDMASPG